VLDRFVGDGLGVGLWVASTIAEDHGGQLSHERTADGLTRFRLWLPVDEMPPVQL